jgi:membrane protease YdiL (CAAX protease family)
VESEHQADPTPKDFPVPPEFWPETVRMVSSGLLVALVAVPVGLLARALRPAGEPLLPRWKPWRVPWGGFEVLAAFLIVTLALGTITVYVLDSAGFYRAVYGDTFPALRSENVDPEHVKEAGVLRALWAGVLVLPLQLALFGALARLYPVWEPEFIGRGSLAGKVWLAVLAWLVLAPAVLVFNSVVNVLAQQCGVAPEHHPLEMLVGRPVSDQALFVAQACVGAPLSEEIMIRGLMLAWCIGRVRIPGAGVGPVSSARPWLVMGAAVAYVALRDSRPPLIFAAVLVVGLAVLWRFVHVGARRTRAVYATAAFFALMHGTWPNPIPLFVLGLGLGWLAVRTNGVLVPVLVHALFNSVSTVFLLRGGTG